MTTTNPAFDALRSAVASRSRGVIPLPVRRQVEALLTDAWGELHRETDDTNMTPGELVGRTRFMEWSAPHLQFVIPNREGDSYGTQWFVDLNSSVVTSRLVSGVNRIDVAELVDVLASVQEPPPRRQKPNIETKVTEMEAARRRRRAPRPDVPKAFLDAFDSDKGPV